MDLLLFLRNGKAVARQAIASLIGFDNLTSGLSATNVQEALDELSTLNAPAVFDCVRSGDSFTASLPANSVECARAGDSSGI